MTFVRALMRVPLLISQSKEYLASWWAVNPENLAFDFLRNSTRNIDRRPKIEANLIVDMIMSSRRPHSQGYRLTNIEADHWTHCKSFWVESQVDGFRSILHDDQ